MVGLQPGQHSRQSYVGAPTVVLHLMQAWPVVGWALHLATALHSFCSRRRPCAGSALLMFSFVRRAAVEQAYQQSKDTPGLLRHLPRRLSARYLWKAHSTLSEPSDGSGSWVTFHQAPSPQSSQVPAAVLPQPFQPQQDESGSKSCWATIPARAPRPYVSSRASVLPKRVSVGRA